MSIRTVIADDEPLARERLDALLRADPEFEVVRHCRNGREVVQALATLPVDLLMLDVRMPGLDGFDALREAQGKRMPMIVFVTAYERFAVDAFGVHAVDYLLKPIELARFREAMAAVKKRARIEAALETRDRYLSRVMVRAGSKELFFQVSEIAWIEAADYYACLHVAEKQHLLRESIKSLETKLDPAKFVRVHRSAIVNVDFVREIHREGRADGWVLLANGDRPRMSAAGWRKLTACFTASR
jgi:two-component system LytT family response regulator